MEEQQQQSSFIAKYSISALASCVYFKCEKNIYLLSKHKKLSSRSNSDAIDNAIKEANCERGNVFEEQLYQRHRDVMVDHSHTRDFMEAFREAEPGKYLYQLKCSLPESFYQDVIGNTTAYRINNFIPDFLYIRYDPATRKRKIYIIDAKASRKMSGTHQFQVASYAFFIAYLVKDIHDLEVDGMGGVWLPSNMDTPEQFRIDFIMNKIQYLYTETLVKISMNPDPQWVLEKKCESCSYVKQCKEDATGTVRSIPYMSVAKADHLKSTSSTVDIEDLSDMLFKLRVEEEKKQPTSSGYEHYVSAYEDKKARFMGRATVSAAKETDHAIYIYLQNDDYVQRPFVYGILALRTADHVKVFDSYFAVDYKEQMDDEMGVFTQFTRRFVDNLTQVLNYMDNCQSRCVFYVYNDQEKKLIHRFLYDLALSGGEELVGMSDTEKQQLLYDAMRCLVVLFQDTQLLGLPGTVHFPELDDMYTSSTIDRFASIEDLLQQNIALGVSGYYTLADAVEWMTGGESKDEEQEEEEEEEELDELSEALNALDLNKIYSQWKRAAEPTGMRSTEKLVSRRFTWLQQIMSTYWRLANEYMQATGADLFPLTCRPFQWPSTRDYNHRILANLVFFKQLECVKACNEMRMGRIQDLSKLGQQVHNNTMPDGLILEYVSKTGEKFDCLYTFSVSIELNGPNVQQKLDNLSVDTFNQYILVPDDQEGIASTVKYPDLLYMTAGKFQKKGGIRCVDIAQVGANKVVISTYQMKKGQRWRLYKRYTDHTTNACINALKELDSEQLDSDLVELIKDPNAWAQTSDMEDAYFNTHQATVEFRDELGMSPSQKDIATSILQKRLQIIWGPPGSGKTEFLALFVNWYIKCFADNNSSSELMIGVTAFTRDAISNLLRRIEKVQKKHGLGALFRVMYVDGQEGYVPGTDIISSGWSNSITKINKMKKETPIKIYVVGATVWKWNKIRNGWKRFKKSGCNMMILDESTQLPVSDALLAIACLSKSNGRLIIAGDHMQLGSIIKNDYSDSLDDLLLYGSIQQCLMRTKDNHAIPTRELLLQKDALHDFGPNTLQLSDNWRMNQELNAFFQHVYGPDYTSQFPDLYLELDWSLLQSQRQEPISDTLVRSILDPQKAISLVKLSQPDVSVNPIEREADIVQQLVETYLDCNVAERDSIMIVTPHHRQRVAIKRKLGNDLLVPVDTVEKMQGQECDLIIACFSCTHSTRGIEFLRDFRRWNVALSRARRKVIVLTVDALINPSVDILNSLQQFEPTDGCALLLLLQAWAKQKDAVWMIE